MKVKEKFNNKKLYYPPFLIVSLIAYIIILAIIGLILKNCENVHNYLKWLLEIPYFKSFVKLSLPILVPIITIISTWTMYKNDKEEKRVEDEKIKRENARPFFFIFEDGDSRYLKFKISIPNSIILKSELFLVGYDESCSKIIEFRALDTKFSYDLTKTKKDQLKFKSSLYIVVKSLTTHKEVVYYVYMNDSSLDENFVKIEENKKFYYKPYYTYAEDKDFTILNLDQHEISSLIEKVDQTELNTETLKFKNNFQKECIHTIQVLTKSRCNPMDEIYRVVELIRYYPNKFDHNMKIKLLSLLMNAMKNSKLKKTIQVTTNEYFAGNMIYNDYFSIKYKELFEDAAFSKIAIQPEQMVEFIREYIEMTEINYSKNEKTNTDFLLRNIEVYLRDDIDIVKNEDILFEIIKCLEDSSA